MLPATLDDLLTDADCSAALLISHRPGAASLALGWPRFTESSHRLLSETLRASTPDPFHDATLGAIRMARWGGRTRRLWLDSLPETNARLSHVTDLLGAATDLLARQPFVTADTTRGIAVRTAGIIAGISYAAATAERQRQHEPMGIHAIRLQGAAARMLDIQRGHAWSSRLDDITAEPLSPEGALFGPGARFQAAALAWRRAAGSSVAPSHQTFALAALTFAQSSAYVWKLVEGTSPQMAEAEKAGFVAAHQSWRHVASLWSDYTTTTPAPVEHRPLAAEVVQAAQALSHGLSGTSSLERGQRLTAAASGLNHLQALALAHRKTAGTLLRAGALYLPTGAVRSTRVQIVGRRRSRLSTCPQDAGTPLIKGIDDALFSLRDVECAALWAGRPPEHLVGWALAERGPAQAKGKSVGSIRP